MASMELPPRKSRKSNEITIQRNRSSLEVLMQMGFPKHRAADDIIIAIGESSKEKSLAATGDKGVQLASDWLISHINDPTLDDKGIRDYILYLCPVGQLQSVLMDYWQKSYQECGWNRAHNYFPHITLCSFFKAEDTVVSKLSHGLKMIVDRNNQLPLETMEFDYFSSANFIGLFTTEKYAQILKQITADFAEEASQYGVLVEPHKKQLHCSLAYQFPPEKKELLENLAKSINLQIPVRWDLRLYSKDQRINNCQVRKVLYTHTARAPDELDLIDGDFIFFDEAEIDSSTDGWFMGTSWLTGCTGLFPGTYTERTAESETWTMHRSIPIVGTELGTKAEVNGPVLPEGICNTQAPRMQRRIASLTGSPTKPSRSAAKQLPTVSEGNPPESSKVEKKAVASSSQMPNPGAVTSLSNSSLVSLTDSPTKSSRQINSSPSHGQSRSGQGQRSGQAQRARAQQESHYQALQPVRQESFDERTLMDGSRGSPKLARRKMTSENATTATASKGPRQLYVVRHGERIDFTFGKDWIQNSFNTSGSYVRYDLNMPKLLPKRKGGPQDFSKDSPLTVQGHFQARLVGEAMKEKEITISHVYASPSLRCVETATSLLEGLGEERQVRIEAGLFEWLGWYTSGMPKFMTPQELIDCGFHVDSTHIPIFPYSKYNMNETTEQYYDRCFNVTKEILRKHEGEGGNLLFIAHKGSVDTCTRQLLGRRPRGRPAFRERVNQVPFCAVGCIVEDAKTAGKWAMVSPGIQPFTHKGGNVLLVAHAASLDVCTRQLVGQPARSHVGFHDILHKVPYCALSVAQEACLVRDTWYLIEPPVLPFAHANNPKYNWTSLTTPTLI